MRKNDCLRTELPFLLNQEILPSTFPFAEEAFNTGPPDAINLWIGNEHSTSSMHKDHYENLYYVSHGEKIITLCPPSNVIFLNELDFDCGSFCHNEGGWKVKPENYKVKWIQCDNVETSRNDLQYTNPITIKVKAGEMLYIPSLWYHRVTQSCETVAINYWFDMKFDMKWCYYNFLQNLSMERNKNKST